ncbi:MAG: hypothetical protein ISQ34_01095 [Rickettsiales bacterium]|nr:hypothetical protein [Rickettsiales bacterium]
MKKPIKTFVKGFTSSFMLMFKNNKLARADRDILQKDKIKIEQDKNLAKSN